MRLGLFIWIGLSTLLMSGCTNLFYHPTRIEYYSPSSATDIRIEEVFFPSQDGTKLHGWVMRPKSEARAKGTIVQFHGNAENLTSHFMSVVWLVSRGYQILTFDYRGYGKSEGDPFPFGIQQDAQAAIAKAKEFSGGAPGSVILYGQSLGGAIALRGLEDLTDRSLIRAIVLESSFLSYKRVAADVLAGSWVTWPFQWLSYLLVSDRYGPKRKIDAIAGTPILVMHGLQDGIVGFKNGRQIFEAAPKPKCFWPIESDGHVDLMNIAQGKYRQGLLDFIETGNCPTLHP